MKIDVGNFRAEDQQRLFDICFREGLTPEDFVNYALKNLLVFDDGPSAQLLEMARNPLHKISFASWCVTHGCQHFAYELITDYESASHQVAIWQPDTGIDPADAMHVAHDALADFQTIVDQYNQSEGTDITLTDAMLDIKGYHQRLETFFK